MGDGIEFAIGLVIVAVLVAVVLRVAAGRMDAGRIARHIASQEGRLLKRRWSPFGKGWLGEQDARIYRVTYVDSQGNVHEAPARRGCSGASTSPRTGSFSRAGKSRPATPLAWRLRMSGCGKKSSGWAGARPGT